MLNPGQKGWLKSYLEFRKDLLIHEENGNKIHVKAKHRTPEESLYSILQPTGLMYGHPVVVGDAQQLSKDWEQQDILKLVLAESFINSSILNHPGEIKNADDFTSVVMKTSDSISDFYNKVYPELSTSSRNFFGQKKSPLDVAEKIIEKRIGLNQKKHDNFWVDFFQNSLLFLDIYFFGQWIHTSSEKAVTQFFKREKEDLRFYVIKVIVAAAHANKIIEAEERVLFNFFLESAELSPEKEKEATDYLNNGINYEDIVLPGNSWILKKFFLELAILTVWADKKLEQSEVKFLEDFNSHIGLAEEDLENSMLAIEGFVIGNWDELGKLQDKHDLNTLTAKYIERVKGVLNKNQERINKEISLSRELRTLLNRAKFEALNPEEKEKVRKELIDILQTIPTFVMISLPNTFLTLPILLQIIPGNLHPT